MSIAPPFLGHLDSKINPWVNLEPTANLRLVRNMLRLLLIAMVSLTLIGCATLAYPPGDPVPEVPNSETLTPGAASPETPAPGMPNPNNLTPAVSDPVKDEPEPAEFPHGSIALFNRVSLGNSSEYWPTEYGKVTWTTGGRAILRYIPDNDSYELMKRITTSSWSSSTIYAMTVGNRLFTIRDWGMDWTSKNKRFGIDELDPATGRQISTTDVTAEWFTVLGDQLYFQSAIVEDFWGGPSTGGHLKVKRLGDRTQQTERKLPVRGFQFHAVSNQLVSMTEGQINIHDPYSGEIQSTRSVDPDLLAGIWPNDRSVFFGEEAIYWAANFGDPKEIVIIRAPLDSEPESVVSFTLEGHETGLVIDEIPGLLMVGVTSPSPPNGLGITQIFLIDLADGSTREIPVERHIPAAQLEAGGGLQMLRLP